MDDKLKKQLEKAKAHFYSCSLLEAYHIFRRYFDRLPFQPEKEHAEYIGMFARILVELGKETHLGFYVKEIESLLRKSRVPSILYSMGVIYSYLKPPQMERGKALFEELVRNPDAKDFRTKAQMMLMDYYCRKNDYGSCRKVYETIELPEDPILKSLLKIWDANLLRAEGKCDRSLQLLKSILLSVDRKTNWYIYFSARLIEAHVFWDQKRISSALKTLEELNEIFTRHRFKTLIIQLENLQDTISKEIGLDVIRWKVGHKHSILYRGNAMELRKGNSIDKLIGQLVQYRFVEKRRVIETLYARKFDVESDDGVLFTHIDGLRKEFRRIGLPPEVILIERNGYRLVAQTERDSS